MVQRMLNSVRETQWDPRDVRRLRSDCDALTRIVSQTQGAVAEWVNKFPTGTEVQQSLALLEARLELGMVKKK